MAAVGNPTTWIPYMMNSKDCSQGFCSLYCPQWCYIVYPPPPPYEYPDDDSSPNFSPLVIAIIGILATAFLLASYYTLISKYCSPRESARQDPDNDLQDTHNPSLHEPWHASTTGGLDEALIKAIAVFKYKKEGFVGITDCSVCLSEFQENESVRLLPKCNHGFHLPCIDTWLKSHSSCPLCRASVFSFNASAPLPAPEVEFSSRNQTLASRASNQDAGIGNEFRVVEEGSMRMHHERVYPKPALRAYSDLSSTHGRHRVIEIRDYIGRSVSMDHSFQSGVSVADMNEEGGSSVESGPSKRKRGGESSGKCRYKRRVLHCVLSPTAMKRSFSSVSKTGRGRHEIIPV
ncbi:hypothetical protein RJT34_02261 [Clitoria ternatea]|uniref:RING-type E3 ubiquitin transferase n=1 Tax=Clitoria ternatea TaxID=43366 RepID=A0AAN9Q098_CLITE